MFPYRLRSSILPKFYYTGIDTWYSSTSDTGIDNRPIEVCNWPIIDMRTLFGFNSRLH